MPPAGGIGIGSVQMKLFLISGALGFLSVIEEECTGNGTLAACRAGESRSVAEAGAAGRRVPAAG